MKRVVISLAAILALRVCVAEVQIIKGGESQLPAGERSSVILNTRDRQIVPATEVTRETKTGPDTGRTETITRLRDADGNYFDWQRVTVVAHEVAPGKIERSTEVIERDRQGGERERRVVKQIVETTGAGERISTSEYRPNSSGALTLEREISSATAKRPDGSTVTARTEKDFDVNGRPVLSHEIEAVTVTEGNRATTTTTGKTVSHLSGRVSPSYREVLTTRTEGATTHSESVRQRPYGSSWENDSRTVTTETRAADGTLHRETIVEGRSLHARQGGRTEFGELIPQRRTVDREVRQADGTVLILREIYRRDVNGDWRPTTFTTQGASRAAW